MKNKVIRQIIGSLFAVTVAGVPAGTVLGAPVAGIFSEMSGETKSAEDTEKAVESKESAKDLAKVTESLDQLQTEQVTETETKKAAVAKTSSATAGIMLAMGDILTETKGYADQAAAENTENTDTAEKSTQTVTEEAASEKTESTEAAEGSTEETTEEVSETAEKEETTEESTEETEESTEEESDGLDEDDVFFTEEVKSDFADKGIAQVEDFVNVRKEASTESDVVGKLYKNNACDVLGIVGDGSWLRIKSGDVEGYVSSDYVSVGDEDVIKSAARRLATVNTETLYVRALPSQDSEIIGMVPNGEVLTVSDESHLYDWGWVGVNIEAGPGYVSAGYVDLSTEYSYGETKEAEEARLRKEEEERQAAAAAAAAAEAAKSSSGKSSSSSSGGSSGVTAPGSSTGSSVANYALQFVGNPYVYGGSSLTNGTDCSGFVMSVYGAFGVGLPHSSSALRGCGYAVDPGSMSPGDIVCYSGHVGICIGNGQIVHASNAATGIKVSTAYYRDILAVRRIF